MFESGKEQTLFPGDTEAPAMGGSPLSQPLSDGCVPSGHHPVLSQVTPAKCNLIKNIPAALTEQGEFLDLGRYHLEERYPHLPQRMLWDGTGGVLNTAGSWFRDDDMRLVCVIY